MAKLSITTSAPTVIPKLVRKSELLAKLPISSATFHRLVANGTFKAIRLSARITAYDVEAVRAYLKSAEVQA
jgi:predicted DNA-binding transcriptional regulator AlpA